MAKRYTDSNKWKKPFLRKMKAAYKLLWIYICDECDHAGIWQVDFEVAQIKIGEKLDHFTATKLFAEKIIILDEGDKWFIADFIEFQYGTLNQKNKVHSSVISILEKHGINIEMLNSKTLARSLHSPKDKDKEMDKDKDKEKEKEPEVEEVEILPNIPFDEFWHKYDKKVGEKDKIQKKWNSLTDMDREVIMDHIPDYIKSQPDKKYRKNPDTYLNNKSWLDEIIIPLNYGKQQNSTQAGLMELGTNSLRNLEKYQSSNNAGSDPGGEFTNGTDTGS